MTKNLGLWIPVAALFAVLALAFTQRGPVEERPAAPRRPDPPPVPPGTERVIVPPPAESPEGPEAPARPSRSPGPVAERVAAVAKELSLQESQRDAFRGLLESYALRFELLHQNTDWTRAGSRQQFEADHGRLQKEFDLLVVRLLTPDQADHYVSLPDWYRTADLGPVAVQVEAGRRR